jgi:hypothetical protein
MTEMLRMALTGRRGSRVVGGLLGAVVATVLLAPLHWPGASGGRTVPGTDAEGQRAISPAPFFLGRAPQRPYAVQTRTDLTGEFDALARIVRALGMRRIAVCGAPEDAGGTASRPQAYVAARACAGASVTAHAREMAALEPQAVIFSGTAADAASFVATLRAERSFAMVVLASSVDREAFARALPAHARTWIAAADARSDPGDAGAGQRALTLAMLTSGDAHGH